MADLTTEEKLYPSLLDRLRDDNIGRQQESRDSRVISVNKLREYVLRDLTWLLNSIQLGSNDYFNHYYHVEQSVINYGIPTLSGVLIENKNPKIIEAKIKRAIIIYEPRIDPTTLTVKVNMNIDVMSKNTLGIEIQGLLWGQPIPSELFLKTEVDVESGGVFILESQNGAA